MPKLTILPAGITTEVVAGTPLLTAILAAGANLIGKCGGEARCGACHVYVNEGRKSLSKTQRAEHAKLDELVGVSSKSRLACQAQMGEEDVCIEILSFV